MISKNSIAGIAAILLVAVFFLYKYVVGSELILESPGGYADFVKRLEQYGFSKLVESSVEKLKDRETKTIYSRHKMEVKSIILMDMFTHLRRDSSTLDFYNTTLPDLEVGTAPESSKSKIKPATPPAAAETSLKNFIVRCMERFEMVGAKPEWSDDLLFDHPQIEIRGFKLGFVPSEALAAFKRVIDLTLEGTHLTKGFESLKALKTLRFLTLSKNGITKLPSFVGFLALDEVRLDSNAIKKIDLDQYLKSGTKEYEQVGIKALNLDGNQIDDVDDDFMKVFPELTEVSLRNNKITKMPKCFEGLEGKVKVDISRPPSTG